MFRNRAPAGAPHLVELLNWRGAEQATRTAFTFEADSGHETVWTYGDLDRRARAVAVALSATARRGDRALVLCPAGTDFLAAIIGSFYAGIVPVPAYPPASARQVGRIDVILRDADTTLIVTTRRTRDRIEKWLLADGRQGRFQFLCVDEVDDRGAADWSMPDIGPDSLAFLQYTSGSSSDPKGVMVSHRNLLADIGMIERCMEVHADSSMISWLPMFHDMGLVGNVLMPLALGARTALISPQSFVQSPVRWLQLITRHRGTITGAPNFGYALSVERVTEEQKAGLDLSALTVCYCGSEPIDARVMHAFIEKFADCGFSGGAFYACYGMAESTLLSTGNTVGAGTPVMRVDADALALGVAVPDKGGPTRALVGCGESAAGQDLLIVDPETRRALPDLTVGEIWIRGPHIAQGYWRRQDVTTEVFGATLEGGEGPYLRTGDLGFVNERNVFVTGRRKDVIIVRGRNHYPQDIERTAAAAHEAVQVAGCAAFSMSEPGDTEQIALVCEVRRRALSGLDAAAVVAAIREAVAGEHELPIAAIVLIRPATLPKTSSGKVRRSATRRAYLAGTLDAVHTWVQPSTPSVDAGSTARADEVIGWLRGYAERRIDSRLIDERRTIPPYIVLDFGNHGLLGLMAPLDAGGLALSHRDVFRVLGQLAAIDLTLASFVGVHNALGLRPLLRYASPAQKEALLPLVAQGRELASFAFTEPAAGSNPTAIEATARPDGHDGWLIRGSKKWIGTAAWSGVIHVFTHLVDAAGARRGITAFCVRQDAPGLVEGAEELTLGMRGMVQNTVHLNDVRVGPEDVLGEVGQGMLIAQDIMEFGRIAIAASAVGVMMRAGQLMTRYASRRGIATGRLLDSFVSRERLTELTVETTALELLVEQFAGWLDAGEEVPKECFAAVKVLAAEGCYRAVDRLMQMLGGRGYIETNLVPQMLRDARLLRIFEGPTETMQMFVGARVATGNSEFVRFLRRLGGAAVATELDELASDMHARRVDGQPAAMALGDAALWGFWLTVAEQAGADREAQWLRGCFERSVASGRSAGGETVLPSDEIEAAIARFAERIGDLDQYRPGVLDEMDPLLRRDAVPTARAQMPVERPVERVEPPALSPATPDRGALLREVEEWIGRWVAQRLPQDAVTVSPTRAFADLGLDSLTAVDLTREIEERFGGAVAPTATWDYPNIRALAAYVAGRDAVPRAGAASADAAPAVMPPAVPAAVPRRAASVPVPVRVVAPVMAAPARGDHPDAIAVVGMACRFPGGASDPERFWSLLRDGVDAVGPVPSERWDSEALYDADPDAPGKLYMQHGAFLEHIDQFDAAFFGISPLEASTMDPQQRLLLEVAWEALENAALAPDAVRGTRTGVFLGLMYQDYLTRQLRERGAEAIGPYLGTGSTFSAAAGRLSYVLGVHGPSMTVDTACSSSLVSVHLACQALRTGECETAIAGGANVIVSPEAAINLSKARMLSPTGRCRTFDATADGYTRGEGCGLIVLKPLAKARADGNRILGIIRGSAVNQDGPSNGLTAPSGSAQRTLMREALAAADVRPEEVGYVECHGTGTPLGDPIEVDSVLAVYGDRAANNPLALGAVKTNFGHLESAAGICGLLKTLLLLQHREIPPHLHLQQINPRIDLSGRPVVIPTTPTPWFARQGRAGAAPPRLASVSAFGFVGTNAHVILEGVDEPAPASADAGPHVLTLSAATEPALDALVERVSLALDTAPSLAEVCYTTNVGRAHLAHRIAATADTSHAMKAALAARRHRGTVAPGTQSRVAYLFTGQGTRAATGGRRLYESEPLFRDTLDRCDALARPGLGQSLVSLLFDEDAPLDQTVYAQPALLALGYALFVQWRAWGITPSVVVGHSVGEYAAACAAGIFTIDDALRIVTVRARLMQALPDVGGMAAFIAPESWAVDAIAGRSETLAVAAVNGPSEVVIAGARDALRGVVEAARGERIHVRDLPVSHAFHSPLMRPMLDEFDKTLRTVTFGRPSLPIVSTVTGRVVEDEMSTAEYWLRQVMAPVRFADAVDAVHARGEHVFLELGPQPILGPLVARTRDGVATAQGLAAPEALATLYVHGTAIDWAAVHRPFSRRAVTLPTYPFQRQRHWLEAPTVVASVPRRPTTLLGERLPEGARDRQTRRWRADVDRGYLREHRLLGTAVWPIAAQIDLALSAAREGLGLDRCRVTGLEFVQTLYSDVVEVQTVLTRGGDLRIYSRHQSGGAWVLNTRAQVGSESEGRAAIDFSVMFFAAKEEEAGDRYRLILEAARYADEAGFRSVWVPERHFTDMGSLYPNPSVLHAALARETTRVGLMAGSVVLPLHNPMRIAEEWAMVDNLSGGRVGLSLASGWNPHDFVLAPGSYDDRYQTLYDGIETIRGLWRGEPLHTTSPTGAAVALRTYPTPVQRELPLWVTAARSPESFRKAGALGANLLTHLLDQDVETLAGKIALYREARAEHGFDPDAGVVTVMCHTFVAPDLETVHRLAKTPFCDYLKSSKSLLQGLAHARKQDVDLDALSDREMDQFVEFLYERFHSTRALIGTPETCRTLVDALHAAGVNEIACLLDFGPSTDEVLAHLPYLEQVRQATFVPASAPAPIDLADIRSRCQTVVSGSRFYDDLAAAGVDFDGSLRTLHEIRSGEREALAGISVAADRAVVVDAALQTAFATFERRSADGPLLVPAGARAVRLHAPLGGRARWAHALRTSDLEGNVTLVDEAGEVLLDIVGLQVKHVPRPSVAPDVADWFYDVRWRLIEPATPTDAGQRPWIVLEDRRGLAVQWARRHPGAHLHLRRGAVTEAVGPGRWTVNPDTGFDELFRHIDLRAYAGILDCWPLDAAGEMASSQRVGIEAATSLLQAMAGAGARAIPRLWLVTRAAQSVLGERAPGLSQATLWGFAGAMAQEHTEWWGGIVDLDADATAADLDRALLSGGREDQMAIRGGQLYARRLARASIAAQRELVFEPGATYVVAGGQGGLGLAVSQWMARRGATRLLLLGRSPADASVLATIGAEVEYRQVDIADETQVAEALAGRQIRGVIHAAGEFHDESLLRLDRTLLWKVLGARVLGAWALHRAVADAPLDFFVLFSSFSALLPPPGQAAYAAAASFLDALAHERRAAGAKAVSINWGAWSEVGFAASEGGRQAHARLEAMGMRRMTPEQGLAALELVMCGDAPPQIAVMPMDLGRAADLGATGVPALLAELVAASDQPSAARALLLTLGPDERVGYLRAQLTAIVGDVLHIPASQIDVSAPLTTLGLDSLIAIQVRNRMQKGMGMALPLVNALRGGSVATLVEDLLSDLRVHQEIER